MPVPFESLLPFALITGFFGVIGTGLNISRHYSNDRKPGRYGLDTWDKQMLERDRRLTGSTRGQTSEPIAPEGFSINSVWYLEKLMQH
ncbi:hypothetical protein BDB01DRAFT_774651 [Pilobolus umbonatus]|nr:hypothetical protein BDB01DRAFT_774651 [Pilobolus umbonatus]